MLSSLVGLLGAAAAMAIAQPPLKAVDLYGSDALSAEAVSSRFGGELGRFAEADAAQRFEERARLARDIETGIAGMGDFAFVRLSLIRYEFSERGRPSYLTVDVVERKDAGRRMPFLPAPRAELDDPGGLIALWQEYEAKGWEAARRGEIDWAKTDCGRAFHCLFGYGHPKLKRYGRAFLEKVPARKSALLRVLREDRRPPNRAAAAFLLAHIRDGGELVRALVPSFRDPEGLARNNAMRVLADMSRKHPELDIPLEPVLAALDYPETTDRNKASAILAGLAERPRHRGAIRRTAGPVLLRLLRLQQPNNHDFAYQILKTVSGRDFGERDYPAWEKWLKEEKR